MSAASLKGVQKHYDKTSAEVQDYFDHLPALIKNFPCEVCIAYMFSRVERAQNMTLYCGVVKLHAAHTSVARSMIHRQHITRDSFARLFKTIFDKPIDGPVAKHIKFAETTRDKVVHGKVVSNADLRKSIVEILDYAESFNVFVCGIAHFKPFGDLRGFRGRATPLEKKPHGGY